MHRLRLLAFALLAVLMLPSAAYAEDLGSSFKNGFNTLLGQPEVSTNDGLDFQREYEPREVVESAPVLAASNDHDIMYWIRSVTYYGTRFVYEGVNGGFTQPGTLRRFLVLEVVPIAVVGFFFWWGLRKSLAIIKPAFRNGRSKL